MNIIQHIGNGVLTVALGIASLLGFSPEPLYIPNGVQEGQEELGRAVNPVATNNYAIAGSGISSSATTITLTSFTAPVSGAPYTMANFGDGANAKGYLTIEPGSRTRQEIVSFTGITQNSDGTATLTGVTRGLLPFSPFTASSTYAVAHNGGSQVVVSNPPQLYDAIYTYTDVASTSLDNSISNRAVLQTTNQTVAGDKTFTGTSIFSGNVTVSGITTIGTSTVVSTSIASGTISKTPTANLDITNKAYVDGVAVAGASDANETTKGIVEQATDAEIIARTTTGGTGAVLFTANGDLDLVASSTIQLYFASTTSGNAFVVSDIAVDANDIVNVFSTAYGSALGGSSIAATLALFDGATTTLSASGQTANTQGSISMLGFYRATSTQTLRVTQTPTGGAVITYADILVQVFKR